MLGFIGNLFSKKSKEKPLEDLTYAPKFRVIITEFVDIVEGASQEIVKKQIRDKDGIELISYKEPFNKSFLNLGSKDLFDWIDKGQSIIDETNADVIIWGFREGDKLRLNFQNSSQFETSKKTFISLMDSLYIPASSVSDESPIPEALINLIHGAIISAINPKNKELEIHKKYILKRIIDKLSSDDSAKSLPAELTPHIMNFLGIIYLSYAFESKDDKDFKIIKNLFETAIKHQDLIDNPIHLGCIYHHLGQLYDSGANHIIQQSNTYFKGAIEYYIASQKYLGRYNYPYEYGSICYRLSHLYFDYWRQKSDIQALRDAVSQLRETEKIYTYALFPEFWATIQENLGYFLSILGNLTSSIEISELAIAGYKNKQKVITEKRDPISWANTQSEIGNIYYKIGKAIEDKSLLEEALEYFHDALYIFENAQNSEEIKKLNIAISKTSQSLSTL